MFSPLHFDKNVTNVALELLELKSHHHPSFSTLTLILSMARDRKKIVSFHSPSPSSPPHFSLRFSSSSYLFIIFLFLLLLSLHPFSLFIRLTYSYFIVLHDPLSIARNYFAPLDYFFFFFLPPPISMRFDQMIFYLIIDIGHG